MRLSGTRALVAGLLGLAGCLTPAERRAVSVADCVAQMALGLPQQPLPERVGTITDDELVLAVLVLDGVRACRAAHPPVTADGGP